MNVKLSVQQHHDLRDHLFTGDVEQVAFGFAHLVEADGPLEITNLEHIPESGFVIQTDYHVELTPETQARIIKVAFDRQTCLVEFHSHRTDGPAEFSPSDMMGFQEFVPHVRWRLGGRPYAAVVFHESTFDGLVWKDSQEIRLNGIEVGDQLIRPTGLTLSPPKKRVYGRRSV